MAWLPGASGEAVRAWLPAQGGRAFCLRLYVYLRRAPLISWGMQRERVALLRLFEQGLPLSLSEQFEAAL